ncbi:hypothetical protein ENBRE01_0658 [Enteropsectra breve]|nr:hypothetical protein ENBRE01_0658 [Enteropsectra breve]
MLISLLLASMLAQILYGLSDYCMPKEIAADIALMYFGKMAYATNWISFLSAATTGLFLVYKHIHKVQKRTVSTILSVSLPIQSFVSIFYWYKHIFDPMSFQKEKFVKAGIGLSLYTSLVQHLFPLICLLVVWRAIPLLGDKKLYVWICLFVCSYGAVSCFGYAKTAEWQYPFLNSLSKIQILVLFLVALCSIIFIYELLAIVEKKRKGASKIVQNRHGKKKRKTK